VCPHSGSSEFNAQIYHSQTEAFITTKHKTSGMWQYHAKITLTCRSPLPTIPLTTIPSPGTRVHACALSHTWNGFPAHAQAGTGQAGQHLPRWRHRTGFSSLTIADTLLIISNCNYRSNTDPYSREVNDKWAQSYGAYGPSQNHILHSHTVETLFHVLQFNVLLHFHNPSFKFPSVSDFPRFLTFP
jgi:hypothetical protein